MRHVGLIRFKRIRHIDIDRIGTAVTLPIGGNRNLLPSGNVIVRLIKLNRPPGRILSTIELPRTIERKKTLIAPILLSY